MHRAQITRPLAVLSRRLTTTAPAPSWLAAGQTWAPPVPQSPRLRPTTTPLGGTRVGAASIASYARAPSPVLGTHSRTRDLEHTIEELQTILKEARQLQDPESRREAFFHAARRYYARNNGCPVDLKDSLDVKLDLDPPGVLIPTCSANTLDQHNVRFSFEMEMLDGGKPQIWVALDAAIGFSSFSHLNGLATSVFSGSTEDVSCSSNTERFLTSIYNLSTLLLGLITHQLHADAAKAAPRPADEMPTVPAEVGFELLVWDTVISWSVDNLTPAPRLYPLSIWKIGCGPPSQHPCHMINL